MLKWVYHRLVNWHSDILRPRPKGEGVEVLAMLCNVPQKALLLQTPKQFFIAEKGLGLADPYATLLENGVLELMRVAN